MWAEPAPLYAVELHMTVRQVDVLLDALDLLLDGGPELPAFVVADLDQLKADLALERSRLI